MKTKKVIAVLFTAFLLASCSPTEKSVPSEIVTVASATVLTPTSTLAFAFTPLNGFIGYWTQTKLSDNPWGLAVCGYLQNVEFFVDGTFTSTNDASGVYKNYHIFGTSLSPQIFYGKYKILDEIQIEISYSNDISTAWKYMFSDNTLAISTVAPDEYGGEYITCYFSKSTK